MFLRITLLITLFFYTCTTQGQIVVENSLTSEHRSVPGTRVSLIPPNGFEKATNFTGFQQTQSGSSIMVVSIPGPVEKIQAGLTREGALSQGVEVAEIEKLIINQMPALLLTGTQNAYGNSYSKFVLCFGVNDETIMINGMFPQNLQEVGKGIKQAMLSAHFDPNKKVNPFEALDFEISTAGSRLVFAKSVANSFVYNIDGKLPTESPDRTSFTIGKSFGKMQMEDKKLFSLNRSKQLYPDITVDSTQGLTIDGISGFEIIGNVRNKKFDQPEKVYLVFLFSDSLYYIMIGSSNMDFDNNLNTFKSTAKSFKRK